MRWHGNPGGRRLGTAARGGVNALRQRPAPPARGARLLKAECGVELELDHLHAMQNFLLPSDPNPTADPRLREYYAWKGG